MQITSKKPSVVSIILNVNQLLLLLVLSNFLYFVRVYLFVLFVLHLFYLYSYSKNTDFSFFTCV